MLNNIFILIYFLYEDYFSIVLNYIFYAKLGIIKDFIFR